MTPRDDGGPAFPSLEVYEGYDAERETYVVKSDVATGMSLRDYFAAKAMHAEFLSSGSFPGPRDALVRAAQQAGQTVCERIAVNAYAIADAMIAERAK